MRKRLGFETVAIGRVECGKDKGERKNRIVFYLNVLHILKEVHFWIVAVSKLNQVFKFWLIWKGLN